MNIIMNCYTFNMWKCSKTLPNFLFSFSFVSMNENVYIECGNLPFSRYSVLARLGHIFEFSDVGLISCPHADHCISFVEASRHSPWAVGWVAVGQ